MNKVEITNELLAGVYGAYIGCGATHENSIDTKLVGWDVLSFKYGNPVLEGTWKHRDDACRLWCYWDECKLLLTPLSEITDEDAIEVARLNRVETSCPELVGHSIIHWRVKNGFVREFNAEMCDYLRSKGYDAGYLNIPSLIEAGIAIKKN